VPTPIVLSTLRGYRAGYLPAALSAATVVDLATQGSDEYTKLTAALAIVTGVIALVAGLARPAAGRWRSDSPHWRWNRQLVGVGASNFGAGLCSGMVVNGSLSKIAVNVGAGAKSQISGLVVAVLTVVTLLFLTGLFEQLPEATLAAVVDAAHNEELQ